MLDRATVLRENVVRGRWVVRDPDPPASLGDRGGAGLAAQGPGHRDGLCGLGVVN